LKQGKTDFCKNIYTTQSYDQGKPQRKYRKPYQSRQEYKPKKKYYLRKSTARKPYLNKDRHVRKHNNNRIYKNRLACFTCGSEEHLAYTCPRKNNSKTRNAQLIEDFQETLVNVDEYMSDNESIYSVIIIDAIEGERQDSSDSEGETYG